MFDAYKEIFNQRGALYHKAMVSYPLAREEEFKAIIDLAAIRDGQIVCDVPSGGGYLNRFIDGDVQVISLETSIEFLKHCRQKPGVSRVLCDLHSLPLKPSSIDVIVSLAGLHHVQVKDPFYREAYRLLKPGGRFCVADVEEGSRVSHFLDEFVDQHNSMGHKGAYITPTTVDALESAGFKIFHHSRLAFHWTFDALDDMSSYIALLFGLDKASPADIQKGLQSYLGYQEVDGRYRLNWGLLFIGASKV